VHSHGVHSQQLKIQPLLTVLQGTRHREHRVTPTPEEMSRLGIQQTSLGGQRGKFLLTGHGTKQRRHRRIPRLEGSDSEAIVMPLLR